MLIWLLIGAAVLFVAIELANRYFVAVGNWYKSVGALARTDPRGAMDRRASPPLYVRAFNRLNR